MSWIQPDLHHFSSFSSLHNHTVRLNTTRVPNTGTYCPIPEGNEITVYNRQLIAHHAKVSYDIRMIIRVSQQFDFSFYQGKEFRKDSLHCNFSSVEFPLVHDRSLTACTQYTTRVVVNLQQKNTPPLLKFLYFDNHRLENIAYLSYLHPSSQLYSCSILLSTTRRSDFILLFIFHSHTRSLCWSSSLCHSHLNSQHYHIGSYIITS